MKRTIALILLIGAALILIVNTAYGQTQQPARGKITMPSGLTIDASMVILRFRLGNIDHKAASTAVATIKCIEQALETEDTEWTWQQCRDRGYDKLKELRLQHKTVNKQLKEKLVQKRV